MGETTIMKEKYLAAKDIAEVLGISTRKATDLIRDHIPYRRVTPGDTNSPYRVALSDFQAYLASTLITPKKTPQAPAPAPWPKGVRRVV